MGCGSSKTEPDDSIRMTKHSRSSTTLPKLDPVRVKLLLLGAGESGKSTILKQMMLIHGIGFTSDEREGYREVIVSNTVQSMRVVMEAMDVLGVPLRSDGSRAFRAILEDGDLRQIETGGMMPVEITMAIAGLYRDVDVRNCLARSREYQLNDSAEYYFESVERIGAAGYVPTDQDILRARVKTTGICETTFEVGHLLYTIYDLGGQRSERKKWVHCFENTTALIFVVAISEYDQVLVEDDSVNRLDEAMILFESICSSKWFINTSIILFFNKIDLFQRKLRESSISRYYPDYQGGDDYARACGYVMSKFTRLNTTGRTVYPYLTCATDTQQFQFVMSAVNAILLERAMKATGLF